MATKTKTKKATKKKTRREGRGSPPPSPAKTKASTTKAPALAAATKTALAQALTKLVTSVYPRAEVLQLGSTTWYVSKEHSYCGIVVRSADVVLRLPGPDHDDPDGLLRGTGKAGKSLHVTDPTTLPVDRIKVWLRARLNP